MRYARFRHAGGSPAASGVQRPTARRLLERLSLRSKLISQIEADARRIDFGRQVGEALELLVADSNQSRLERFAVRKGVATSFETSETLDACHRLRGRPGGACSAVCAPISFVDGSHGVLHATGPPGSAPFPDVRRQLVTLSRHAGARIGTLCAFARTELQASTEGLTGLFDRRTLQSRVRDLSRGHTCFAPAIVDLDRFKQLNDTYGHEAGDRALRQVAQVIRDSMCGDDIAARCGSELEEVPRVADARLLRAQAEGRDRIVVGTAADAAALVARAA